MHAFDVLGDPVRRRILEILRDGESTAGDIVELVGAEFGISQPAVSHHLRILRENGFADARSQGTRRLYALRAASLADVDDWLDELRRSWTRHTDALATELARGARARRKDTES